VFPALLALVVACRSDVPDRDDYDRPPQDEVAEAKNLFLSRAPHLQRWFDESYGYAIFPELGKGAAVVGGGGGQGYVYEKGRLVGYSTLTLISAGAQLGGEGYSEVIFFEDQATLDEFKRGNLEFGATVNAVAADSSRSRHAAFDDGVAVFTVTRGGLMVEASVSGQKFTYRPIDR
jgi:lipid-binding SYLF domain-containing protein